MQTLPKGIEILLHLWYSGIRQKHLQTKNYKEFCYVIKVLIIDCQLPLEKNKIWFLMKHLNK